MGKPTVGTMSQAYLFLKIETNLFLLYETRLLSRKTGLSYQDPGSVYLIIFFPSGLLPLPGPFCKWFLKVITILHIITISLGWISKCCMFAMVKIFRAGFGKLFL